MFAFNVYAAFVAFGAFAAFFALEVGVSFLLETAAFGFAADVSTWLAAILMLEVASANAGNFLSLSFF